MTISRAAYGPPLTPPRENRYEADDVDIVEVLANDKIVTLSEAKIFLPVTHSRDDAFITRIIDSVTRQVENFKRLDVLEKQRKAYWMSVPPIGYLPFGPIQSVDEVKVVDRDGNESILEEGADFFVTGMQFKSIRMLSGYGGELFVTYTSGYEADKRPPEMGGAIQQEISLQYKNRQDPDTPAMTSVNNLSIEARHLLGPLRGGY